ncbi:tetratricopeptide repeat protein [Ornithobacterium rhinotracheale]|uniref:tetratricopeptide repeat protein n=1 Tax=Ornithobacterium rhinotracheale TaxID=28251 RepID=UPI001FF42E98|nr:tetratricopeptide repeat protein [Ornithobacterium rhinotracheale]MCK0202304.1 tetratricopeptide repeat protein [Ornithobacterium rhinotracheale]
MAEFCIRHLERYWGELIQSANEYFMNGKNEQSLEIYTHALFRAEVLASNPNDCLRLAVPFIKMYVDSQNYLVQNYIMLNDLKNARNQISLSTQFLMFLYSRKILKISELEEWLLRNHFLFQEIQNHIDNKSCLKKIVN